VASSCLRIGTVTGILWLAQPQLKNMPRWLVAVSAVVLLVAMRWPRLLLVAVPLALAFWILSPWGAKAALARRQDPTLTKRR
jgi:hypothetical protein